jgi:hypothetical protein
MHQPPDQRLKRAAQALQWHQWAFQDRGDFNI